MPPRIPNFPAHASLDVWQESWLLSRSSRIAGSAPGATTHDRPPALPRVTRDGALASPADGAAPVDERLRLGRAALSECLQAGGGCAGLLPARRAASSARPAPVALPLRWPLPWTARVCVCVHLGRLLRDCARCLSTSCSRVVDRRFRRRTKVAAIDVGCLLSAVSPVTTFLRLSGRVAGGAHRASEGAWLTHES